MAGRVQEESGSVGDDRVEVTRRQIARRLEEDRVELTSHHPLVGSDPGRLFPDLPDRVQRVVEGRPLEGPDVGQVAQPRQQGEVHVRLDEAG